MLIDPSEYTMSEKRDAVSLRFGDVTVIESEEWVSFERKNSTALVVPIENFLAIYKAMHFVRMRQINHQYRVPEKERT